MSNPFDQFDAVPNVPKGAPENSANPFDRFDAQQQAQPRVAAPAKRKNVLDDVIKSFKTGTLQGATGLAGTISQSRPGAAMLDTAVGMADNIENLVNVIRGAPQKNRRPFAAANVPGLRTILTGAPDTEDLNRSAQALAGRFHEPTTTAGRYAQSIGQMTPALVAPGSVPARIANTVIPGLTAQASADVAARMGFGQRGQDVARMAGGLFGGALAQTRLSLRPKGLPARDPVYERIMKGQDPQEIAQRRGEFEAAGIRPTLADVVDDSARGTVRAAGVRQTPGRQMATNYADARALDLPSRMSQQARRVLSNDPRTPDQIRTDMTAQRGQQADNAFGAVRQEPIGLDDNSIMALRTTDGRDAIRAAAARAARSINPDDRAIAARLNRLADDVIDNPAGGSDITVGMAQHISEALFDKATTAASQGAKFEAASFNNLGRALRDNARRQVPGYDEALRGYEAGSRLVDAAEVGENLLTRNTDEFTQQASVLGDQERELALAAARRAIERKSGESIGSAPGVARQIAMAPEQQARTAALAGPERAAKLQNAMRLEELRVRNASDIAPRAGSRTSVLTADGERLNESIQRGAQVARAVTGGWSERLNVAADWLKSMGLSDRDAQRIIEASIDPSRVDEAVSYLTNRIGAKAAHRIVRFQVPEWLGLSGAAQRPTPPSPQSATTSTAGAP